MAIEARRAAPVAISLGSNEGDRLAHLRSGVAALRQHLGRMRLSSVYETKPMYRPDQTDFLNACCTGRTRLSGRQLLAELHGIETRAGRRRSRRYGPRPLDLDLLLYGESVIDTSDLVVPHPRMHERAFVLEPLTEIAAEWRVPGVADRPEATVEELAAVVSSAGVRRTNLRLEDG